VAEENIISNIKKCIAFIYSPYDTGRKYPIGTGFWILVKKEDSEGAVGYFVTAKHVILDENDQFLPQVVMRLTHRNGSLTYQTLRIDPKKLLTHSDKDVDIAVYPSIPDSNVVEFKGIPANMINTKQKVQEVGIREGDDVFFAGLFTSYYGVKKNHPIFRFGKVALMTDEKIEWKEKDKKPIHVHLYLVECQSFGGNSGSPVFFNLSPTREPGIIAVGGPKISLAGIVKGSFLSTREVVKDAKAKEERLISQENVGISAITPAFQLNEILFRDDVVKLRNKG